MTFTEAALEILRRAGKPLHFKEIASEAVGAGILSHVGQTPEATMGARLLSMSRREHDRKVVAMDTGIFALAEWGLPLPGAAVAPVVVEQQELAPGDPLYRTKERHPPMQGEMVVGARRDERRRRSENEDEEGRRKKKYAPPADVAYQWLRERGQPATLAELAHGLRENDRIAEALERDLDSLEKALKEENRRRQDSRRPPLFELGEGGVVKALELPKETPRERPERPQRAEKPRREEPVRAAGLDEQRRNVARTVRRRFASLDGAALERIAVALLEAQGFRELNMARRSAKEGPLYLARHKWGAGEFRYAIRVLRPGRDLGRIEVSEIRRDLSHYSAQVGIVFSSGECSREAKSEANLPNQPPVMVYGGEALADALVDAGLGATKRLVEWFEYDDDFFSSMGAGEAFPDVDAIDVPAAQAEPTLPAAAAGESSAPVPAETPAEGREDRSRRPRDRRRDRRPREGAPVAAEGQGAPSPSVPEDVTAPAEAAGAQNPREDHVESTTPPALPQPTEMPAEPAAAPPATLEVPPAPPESVATLAAPVTAPATPSAESAPAAPPESTPPSVPESDTAAS